MAKVYLGDLPPGVTDVEAYAAEHGVEQAEVEALIAETATGMKASVKPPEVRLGRLADAVYARAKPTAVAKAPPAPRTFEAIAEAVYRRSDDVAEAAVEGAPDDLSDLVAEIRVDEIYQRYNGDGQKKGGAS